jgi:hypothetical protein
VLGDRDRATLHEIQNQFLLDDPGFVQSFDARPSRPTAQARTGRPTTPTAPTAQRRRTPTMFRLIAGCCACCCRPRPTVGVLLLGMSAVAVVVVVHPMVGTTGTDGGSGPRL